jgi:hypothetical protein
LGTDGNEIAEQLATEGPSHPLIGPESALGISVKVAREVIRYQMNSEKCWQSICESRQAMAFLKKPSAKKAGELLSLNRNQLRIMTGLLTGHCHLKGQLFQMGLLNSPKCDRCKQVKVKQSLYRPG